MEGRVVPLETLWQRYADGGYAAVRDAIPADADGCFYLALLAFAEGEPGDRLYIIINGKVKIGRRSPDGRENLLTIMGPSDMFGELSIFDPGPRTSSATTITEVRAVSMDREALRAWIADRPEIAEQLLRLLAQSRGGWERAQEAAQRILRRPRNTDNCAATLRARNYVRSVWIS